jgi:neutral ceramidase
MPKLGFAHLNITPEPGTWLAGFSPLRQAIEIESELTIKLVILQSPETTVWIQIDTIAVDIDFYQQVCQLLAPYGIQPHQLMVHATHTHSGPEGLVNTTIIPMQGMENIFGHYLSTMVQHYLNAIERLYLQALNKMNEIIEVKSNHGQCLNVMSERHDQNLPSDQLLTVIELTTTTAKILFYHMPMHPTILNQLSTLISADLPGAVASGLTQYSMVYYLNGCAGDMSSRFTRISNDRNQLLTFRDIIVQRINDLISTASPVTLSIKAHAWQISLPTRSVIDQESAKQQLERAESMLAETVINDAGTRRLLESKVEGTRTQIALMRNLSAIKSINLTINVVELCNIKFISFPGELYSKLGQALPDDCRVIGYANGYYLYLPDKQAYNREDYEVYSSFFEVGSGEWFINELKLHLLEETNNEN